MKPIAVYKGGTFKALIRRYSTDRIQRDADYKAEVDAEMERRRQEKKCKSVNER